MCGRSLRTPFPSLLCALEELASLPNASAIHSPAYRLVSSGKEHRPGRITRAVAFLPPRQVGLDRIQRVAVYERGVLDYCLYAHQVHRDRALVLFPRLVVVCSAPLGNLLVRVKVEPVRERTRIQPCLELYQHHGPHHQIHLAGSHHLVKVGNLQLGLFGDLDLVPLLSVELDVGGHVVRVKVRLYGRAHARHGRMRQVPVPRIHQVLAYDLPYLFLVSGSVISETEQFFHVGKRLLGSLADYPAVSHCLHPHVEDPSRKPLVERGQTGKIDKPGVDSGACGVFDAALVELPLPVPHGGKLQHVVDPSAIFPRCHAPTGTFCLKGPVKIQLQFHYYT